MSKTVLIQGMGPKGLKPALKRVVETWPLLANCEAIPKDVISLDVRIHLGNGGGRKTGSEN
jgi:hypothetical protein